MHRSFGILFFLLACLLTIPMFLFIKFAAAKLALYQVLGMHFLASCLVLIPFIMKNRQEIKEDGWILLFRAISGLITFHAIFIAAKFLPLGILSTLLNTSPFFVGIFLWLLLRKIVPRLLWLVIAVGFLGVLLVLRPSQDYHFIGSLLALIAGLFSGLSMVLSQRLVQRLPPVMISFYSIFAGACVHLPLVIFWDFSSINILPILSGLLFALELYCFTKAFQYVSTQYLAPLNYLGVVFSVCFDIFVFRFQPSLLSYLGFALIILCGSFAIYLSRIDSIVTKEQIQ